MMGLQRDHTHLGRDPGCRHFLCPPVDPAILPGLASISPRLLPLCRRSLCVASGLLPPLGTFLTVSQCHSHSPRGGLLGVTALASTMSPQKAWVAITSFGPQPLTESKARAKLGAPWA